MNNDINFFMQRVDIPSQPEINLEKEFPGLRYVRSKGIDDIGAAKVYEEVFPESGRVNVYIPDEPVNAQTKIEMTFVFLGDDRRKTRDRFEDYLRRGIHRYWDTARNKEFSFYVKDKIETSEEKWRGSTPYIEVTYKLNNIEGKTKEHV